MNEGPVFIVDNDQDDQEFIRSVWQELKYQNELLFFQRGEAVLRYLKTNAVVPFLIISDVNLPGKDGYELKKQVLDGNALYYKSVPFVFLSDKVSNEQIKKAYDLRVNGFFIKDNTLQELKSTFAAIVQYWMRSVVPE